MYVVRISSWFVVLNCFSFNLILFMMPFCYTEIVKFSVVKLFIFYGCWVSYIV